MLYVWVMLLSLILAFGAGIIVQNTLTIKRDHIGMSDMEYWLDRHYKGRD